MDTLLADHALLNVLLKGFQFFMDFHWPCECCGDVRVHRPMWCNCAEWLNCASIP